MSRPFEFRAKLKVLYLLVIIFLAVVACSSAGTARPGKQPGASPTHPMNRHTSTSHFNATAIPMPSATATPSPSPSIDLTVKFFPIESKGVQAAFWSNDDNLVYYAFRPSRTSLDLEWAVYDVTTQSTTTVSSPLKYDPSIWSRLGVPNPRDSVGLYPELLGYVSPSGQYAIYTLEQSDQLDAQSNSSKRTTIWLADINSLRRLRLLEIAPRVIHQAAWFEEESKVIFSSSTHGPADLYIANTQTGATMLLADISDFNQPTEEKWALSPDGASLAIVGREATLWLVSLRSGTSIAVEKNAIKPYWSKDGQLFYWWGPTFEEIGYLHSFDPISESISTVIDQSTLINVFPSLPRSDFAISAAGNRIVFWGGGLWLLELPE